MKSYRQFDNESVHRVTRDNAEIQFLCYNRLVGASFAKNDAPKPNSLLEYVWRSVFYESSKAIRANLHVSVSIANHYHYELIGNNDKVTI